MPDVAIRNTHAETDSHGLLRKPRNDMLGKKLPVKPEFDELYPWV